MHIASCIYLVLVIALVYVAEVDLGYSELGRIQDF